MYAGRRALEAATAGCEVLMQPAEKAGSTDPAAVCRLLSTERLAALDGSIELGPNGQNEPNNSAILQIQNGKYIVLDPQGVGWAG